MPRQSIRRITAIATTVALFSAPVMASAHTSKPAQAPAQAPAQTPSQTPAPKFATQIASAAALVQTSAPTRSSLPRGLVEVSGTLQTFGPYFSLNGIEVDAGARWWRVSTQASADLDGNGTRQSWDEELRGLVGKNVRILAEADDYDYDVIEINGVSLRSALGPPPWAGGPWRGEFREGRGERGGDWDDDWDDDWRGDGREGRGERGERGEFRGAREIVLDRQQTTCGRALVTAKLEQDSREREVDIEVYSDAPGERWQMTIKDASGNVLRTASRATNFDAEFDVTRTISGSVDRVTVEVRGPAGQECSVQLRA